jgi:hypothetical protein
MTDVNTPAVEIAHVEQAAGGQQPSQKKSGGTSTLVLLLVIGAAIGAGFLLGQQSARQTKPKLALIDRTGLTLEAVMKLRSEGVSADEAAVQANVIAPAQAVLRQLVSEGYIVVDSMRDDQGAHLILALPEGAENKSAELRAALKLSPLPSAQTRVEPTTPKDKP